MNISAAMVDSWSKAKFETDIKYYLCKCTQHPSQVASKGIRVNSVNPGVIVTGIFEKAGMTSHQVEEYYEARMNDENDYLIILKPCLPCFVRLAYVR